MCERAIKWLRLGGYLNEIGNGETLQIDHWRLLGEQKRRKLDRLGRGKEHKKKKQPFPQHYFYKSQHPREKDLKKGTGLTHGDVRKDQEKGRSKGVDIFS